MKRRLTPGGLILTLLTVASAVIFPLPVLWSLAVSLKREGMVIGGALNWFLPPYTLENYPRVLFGSDVMTWLWNLWPLLVSMNSDMFTLPIGIPTFAGTYTIDRVLPMTANMVASIPMIILFLLLERYIVKGVSMSGIKG